MFLLITGASGMGKSTVRTLVRGPFAGQVESAELVEIAGPPEWTLCWRHQAVEKVVQRAVQAQREGRHFLLCGDPVPPAEVYAAPSAGPLEGIAVCLLDATPEAQRSRLEKRGDDPTLFPHHVAFADWMREHIGAPAHRLDVIRQNGWSEMRWERLLADLGRRELWTTHRIDTTERQPEEVADLASEWIRRVIGGGPV